MAKDSGSGRSKERFQAALPARLIHGGKEHDCEAHNLSRGGVLLTGSFPDPGSSEVEVVITASRGDLDLRLAAVPVHTSLRKEDAQTAVGLEFVNLTPAQRERLESLVHRVIEGMAPAALDLLPEKASPSEIRKALQNIPLPHRVMLARRGQIKERALLIHDSHPDVLEALARNPNIILPEILVLARLHHIAPSTVKVMAEDPRWADKEEVKILLATHPRATFATADKLVESLSGSALQKVLHRPGLQPGVRKKLMARLARRAGR
jgi:hypothetical protein